MSGIAGRGDSSLIRPVPDAETLPYIKVAQSGVKRRKVAQRGAKWRKVA